jgi:hypothetical protein
MAYTKNLFIFFLIININFSIACENLKEEEIKKLYFSQVEKDVEALGLFCLSLSSKNTSCNQKDKELISKKWNEFVDYARIDIKGKPQIDKKGDFKICSYPIVVGYGSANAKIKPDEMGFYGQAKLSLQQKEGSFFSKAPIEIEKNNWEIINIKKTLVFVSGDAKNISPLMMSVEYFRRKILLHRLTPLLSNEAMNKWKKLDDYVEDKEFFSIMKIYFDSIK